MDDQTTRKETLEELERMFQDKEFRELMDLTPLETPVDVNESPLSSITTPGPLDTAFLNETDASTQHSQISLSSQQSQTTKEASSSIHGLINTILKQEQEIIDLRTPTKTMVSTGTMPKTPTMVSTGTMPRTPTMISTGTMPRTPTMKSTGTMPKTPTMASMGTMPRTPTMASTGTMPRTPTTTASPSRAANETIDLSSSPIETIDLCSPKTPTNTDSPN